MNGGLDINSVLTSWVFYIPGLGIALPILALYLRGKLPTPEERRFLQAENARKDAIIDAKDDYIKKLVSEMQIQNDAIRHDVLPSMANVTQQIILLSREKNNG